MTSVKEAITAELVRELFAYDPLTGVLTWRVVRSNSARIGGPALAGLNERSYRRGRINVDGNKYDVCQHRIIWLHQTGVWPDQIDHINGVRADNRWANLRDVTRQENSRNIRLSNVNTSGTVGVSWDKRRSRWHSYIKVNRRHRFLGYFTNKDDAIAARKAAELKHGFHSNHGKPPNQQHEINNTEVRK